MDERLNSKVTRKGREGGGCCEPTPRSRESSPCQARAAPPRNPRTAGAVSFKREGDFCESTQERPDAERRAAEKMTTFFKTLRNHWKKTTAGLCLLTWGGHWLYGKHCDNLLRRAACQEAQVFGNQLIPPNAQVKKATVFLNPAACKGKARTLFEKNAAPILHLSGMDVTVVKTDYEGQAKKLLELMETTDVIIVAGGDGTLQELVNEM